MKAHCKTCLKEYKYDQVKIGTNSLKGHLISIHPAIMVEKENVKKGNCILKQL